MMEKQETRFSRAVMGVISPPPIDQPGNRSTLLLRHQLRPLAAQTVDRSPGPDSGSDRRRNALQVAVMKEELEAGAHLARLSGVVLAVVWLKQKLLHLLSRHQP